MVDNKYNWILFIIDGTYTTLAYSIIAVFFGFLIGSMVAMMRLSKNKITSLVAKFYISILRGTPVLLQLSFWYFAFPRLMTDLLGHRVDLPPFVAGSIAFSINSSAYVAEIVRAGINAVHKGQAEAAQTLGVPKYLIMKDIVLPQAFKKILPALINEVISMIKETAIIGTIGVHDIMRRSTLVAAEKYTYFAPLMVAAATYYILIALIVMLGNHIEKKLNK